MGKVITSCAVLKTRVHSLPPVQLPGGKVATCHPSAGRETGDSQGLLLSSLASQ